jgi:hypothetical protein
MTTLSEEYNRSRQSCNFHILPLLKLSQNHTTVLYLQTPLKYMLFPQRGDKISNPYKTVY